ncbi:hypothetical protein GCM10022420_086500 [Streptomyces iranensis]|uniref:Uncharacterized protein n=1 Tax=Streptomyces iranensis TaxID=576784 RepID=A0A061AAF8_9ACTN|nr:predicted protein [Streptomyces iranensis]
MCDAGAVAALSVPGPDDDEAAADEGPLRPVSDAAAVPAAPTPMALPKVRLSIICEPEPFLSVSAERAHLRPTEFPEQP